MTVVKKELFQIFFTLYSSNIIFLLILPDLNLKKMNKFLLSQCITLLAGIFLISSCQNNDDADSIFFRTDGSLSAVLVDDNGDPIVDQGGIV